MLGSNKQRDKNNCAMASSWYPVANSDYNFTVDPPSNSREQRNRAEKLRRDRLNSYINQLAQLVPMIARSVKRMDKTSILRLAATHLRIYQILSNGNFRSNINVPRNIDQFLLEQLVSEQLQGFLLVLTPCGKIVFVSQTVEELLGHLQTDLMGNPIFNITAPEDIDRLKMYIGPDGLTDPEHRKQFFIHLKRAGPRTESAVYELCSIMGIQTSSRLDDIECASESSSSSSLTLNSDVLVFFVKLRRPPPLIDRLIEATKDEYITRHLVDGRIVACDQRISLVVGYMAEEVSGLSAFNFMHKDDVRWVMIALRQMYDRGESRGGSCYRLLTRNGEFVYLRTSGYLEIGSTGVVESFVCVNTLVTDKEAKQLNFEMKKKFSAVIKSSASYCTKLLKNVEKMEIEPAESKEESVEDPSELKVAIANLIRNLPASEQRSTPRPQKNSSENQDCDYKNSCSPHAPLTIQMKPLKRPIIEEPVSVSTKRRKSSSEKSPLPACPNYARPKISEISESTSPSLRISNHQHYAIPTCPPTPLTPSPDRYGLSSHEKPMI